MRVKYCFILFLIVAVLFSVGCVFAEDNVTFDDAGDLSISVEVFDEKPEYSPGDYIFMSVTASVDNGTAKNVKVHESLENMEYVSHHANKGKFNPITGIWDIGDLNSSYDAKLFLSNKIKAYGNFSIILYTTSDSNDSDLSNNALILKGVTKDPVYSNYTTKSSDDKLRHNYHYASTYVKESSQRQLSDNDYKNNISDSSAPVMFAKTSRNSFDFIKSLIINVFSPGIKDDYTSVPIMIVTLFFILLSALIVFDKKH